MKWLCSVCKHIAIGGAAPARCPVCGAPGEKFKKYEAANGLAGTRTHENLKAAFAGESQANRRYLAYAVRADLDGNQEAAGAFRQAAEDETAHAHSFLAYLNMIGGTPANLKAAIDGEKHENDTMYPEFARVAREEGFDDLAKYFENVAHHEARHAARYGQVLANKT